MSASRVQRAGAVAVATLCALTLLGACGDSDGDRAEIAKQDRAVQQANQAAAAYRKEIKAALRKKWRARAKAQRAQARARAAARGRQAQVVVRVPRGNPVAAGSGDICAPIRQRFRGKAGRAERRARALRRRQALSYLNLRCPSLGTPRV